MTRSNHKPDKDSAGNKQENPDHKSPPVSASTVIDEPNTPIGEDRTTNARNDERPYWQRPVKWDRWFAAILVACAVIQAAVGWYQWDSMKEQTGVMQSQLEQADTAIAQTQATINEMREARQPWLTLGSVTIEKLNRGEQLVCRIVIENSGQSFGIIRSLNVNLAVVLHGDATNKEFFAGIPKEMSRDMGITVPADGSWEYLGFGPKVTETMIKGFANNSHEIMFGGSLNWEDRAGNKTTTGMFAKSAPFAAKEGEQLTIEHQRYYVKEQ